MTSIGVAIVPSTLEAERAVTTKMYLARVLPSGDRRRYRWVASAPAAPRRRACHLGLSPVYTPS